MNSYISTLRECNEIAKKEYNEVVKKLKNMKAELLSSQKILVDTRLKLEKSKINNGSIYESLDKVNQITTELLEGGFTKFENSFKKKSNTLSDFTVTLFGRTKAGKSTIREALTNGDGSSIGKGAQRTTRDIKIYRWNHLRIIDTPGIDAYKGEEDEKIAFSVIDETDLILFLITSDNIEESEFKKLSKIRRENKPVIILLNVLYDLKHPIKRKQFLKNPQKFISMDAIKGHLNRIKFLSKKHLGISNIKVIPIHALAAFESTKEEGEDRQRLYDASNFKYFSYYLTKVIEKSGKQKRVQSFRDSFIFHLENDVKSVYEESYKNLVPIVRLLKNKQRELRNWFDRFIPEKNDEIEKEIKKIFTPLFNQLDSFVDENIEKSNFGELWSKKVNTYVTEDKIKSIQEKIISDMNRYLEEFFKEFEFDLNLSISNIKGERVAVRGVKKSNTGKIVRWGGATASVVSAGISLAIELEAIANFWNPLGWALGAVAIGLAIFSWFWGNDTKRFNREKSRIKTKMFNNLEKMQRKNKGALRTWFYENITKGLKKKITQDLYNQVKLFQQLLDEYSIIIDKIEAVIAKENVNLLKKLFEIQTNDSFGVKNINKVARVQGVLTKILVEKPIFNDNKTLREFTKYYGERLVEIEDCSDRIKLILNSLGVNANDIESISFNEKSEKYLIKVRKENAGKIYGHLGSNIRTTEKIIGKRIKVEVV